MLTLEQVVAAVRERHPALEAGRARIGAAEAAATGAGAWDDPLVGVEIMREGTTDPFDPSAFEWMIEQRLPLSRRNRLAADVASASTGLARAALAARELALVAEAKAAFAEYAGAERRLELNAHHQGLVRQLVGTARSRFQIGGEPQATVLLAETDLARLEQERLALASAGAAARTRLRTLMSLEPGATLGRPHLEETPPLPPAAAALESLALGRHPEVQSAVAALETESARLALAKRNRFPDPAVRIAARTRNGGGRVIDDYDTAIVFNLPWANPRRTRNEVLEAEQSARAARAELDAVRLEAEGAVREQWERLDAQRRRLALTADRLLSLARQNVDAARIAYETGRVTFLELISALRTATELEGGFIADLTDYHAGLARLEALAGGTLPND